MKLLFGHKWLLKGLTALFACLCLSCSFAGFSRRTHTITFRACILDVKPLHDGAASVLLTVWHVGPEPDAKDLLPGANIRLQLRDFAKLYGKRMAEAVAFDPIQGRGFTFNYCAEQASDGSLSRLRFAPKGAEEKLIVSNRPFADPRKVISATQ